MEMVIAGSGVGLVGGVAEDVLVAEFGVDFRVDFIERFFFGDFEEAGAGGLGHFLEDFFAVRVGFFGAAWIAAASHTDARAAKTAATVGSLIGKENAVEESVGALSGFDGFGEGFLAAVIDAVSEDDERLAALLFLHQFVGGEVDGVVEKCTATTVAM